MSVTECLWVNISFLRGNAIVIKSLEQYCSDGKLERDIESPSLYVKVQSLSQYKLDGRLWVHVLVTFFDKCINDVRDHDRTHKSL